MLLENKLIKKLNLINDVISERYEEEKPIGILSGLGGLALFNFYYSRFQKNEDTKDIGFTLLSCGIERISQGFPSLTYCSGIAGFGWTMSHLVEENFIDIDYQDYLVDLDEVLYNKMLADLEESYFDYLHGAIGYAYYFFKQFKNTQSKKNKKKYEQYLMDFLTLLKKISVSEGPAIKWKTITNPDTGVEDYNLGLAHGLVSIINFLSRLNVYPEFHNLTNPMLKGGIIFLLSTKNHSEAPPSFFPYVLRINEPQDPVCRLGWCYGDLGTGITLLKASKILKDKKIGDIGESILLYSTSRKSPKNTGVIDAGLCHGSFGNAYIFNKLYRQTKQKKYREAATFWIKDGLGKANFEDGFAGYKQFLPLQGGWVPQLSLLEGIAGIGLSIIDYLSPAPSNWDECLMLS